MGKNLKYDTDALKRKDQTPVTCLYNDAINCNLRDMSDVWFCNRCGWNPREQEKRKQTFLKECGEFKFEIKK